MNRNAIAIFFLLLSGISSFLYSQPDAIQPEDITIYRDQWGVPHIYGKTDADVAYGLAWANAEDNFYDMQLNLLMARARQAEVLGKDGAIVDYAVQLLRARETVRNLYDEQMSPEFEKVLNGYIQGINAYAEAHPEDLIAKNLTPVNSTDILTGYMMSLTLIGGLHFHLKNVLDGNPGGPTPHSLRGSNGFAFNSAKTSDGQVYLANNSHQPVDGPTAWYEAHLVSEEGQNCLGGLFPGGLSVFAGVNPDLAWMHTVNFPDVTDVYELEMHPTEKLKYKYDGEWKVLEESKAKMKVKLGPVKLKVGKKIWWSVYGPTMKDKKGRFFAFRYAAQFTIQAAEQWHRMNKATNFTEFYDAMKMRGLPSLNVVYGDRRDTIFYMSNGRIPHRDPKYDWVGLLPGNTSETRWETFHPIEDMPQLLNPPSGYVFNTNNTPFDATDHKDNLDPKDWDATIGNTMITNNRSRRFHELVDPLDRVSYADFKRIKYDEQYPEKLIVHFMTNVNDLWKLDKKDYPDLAAEIDLINNWDKRGHKDSRAAGFFVTAFYRIAGNAIEGGRYFYQNTYTADQFADALRWTSKYMKKHFGRIDAPLGEVQRHVRDDLDLPVGGMPDVIAAMNTKPWKKGRRHSHVGDSYIQLIRFSENGVEIESINTFGASNRKESPHFADQMERYLNHQTKEISLDKDWVLRNARRKYHPGQADLPLTESE